MGRGIRREWEWDEDGQRRGSEGRWGWRKGRRSSSFPRAGGALITEESESHLVLIQPWEQEKHVRKMKATS